MTKDDRVIFEQMYSVVNIYSRDNDEKILNNILTYILNSNIIKENNNELLSLNIISNDENGNLCQISGMFAGEKERGTFNGEYIFSNLKAHLLLDILAFKDGISKQFDDAEMFELKNGSNKCKHYISISGNELKTEIIDLNQTNIEDFKDSQLKRLKK